MSPLLDIRDLCIGFDAYGQHRRVLHNVDLHVNTGERVDPCPRTGGRPAGDPA